MQAHGIIGNEGAMPIEVEQAPAVSLTLANMEGAEVTSFTVTGERLPDAGVLVYLYTLLLLILQSSLHLCLKRCRGCMPALSKFGLEGLARLDVRQGSWWVDALAPTQTMHNLLVS